MTSEQKQESVTGPGFVSRRKTIAAISILNHQINNIREEIDHLESLCFSSVVCQELVSSVESLADPLLTVTKGPTDAEWDRWFRAAGRRSGDPKRWL
ncbi:hypothetical protein QQ045_003384 [Rhodiola kirilowii]